ncbi:DUF5713 family protein [uncultured Bacteroides sp.]|uniref:DUF5713 family protein n=1 Tax=uncultured Bacteroides sp. TaxID=162156 RepID=UPI0025F557F4|nr:DUF5713 family protein [uncultured Bacteroides sp.]
MRKFLFILLSLLSFSVYAQKGKVEKQKKFDSKYVLLKEMYKDQFFPKKCVDKVAKEIKTVIVYIEQGGHSEDHIQAKFDKMTFEINKLQACFEDNDSEIETVARESISETVEYILQYFNINIEYEEALRNRDW